jgi:hypothetical protein
MQTKLVYINSIPRNTVSKVSEFRNVGQKGQVGNKLNKTKIFEHCKDGIQALYSPKVGGLKTGLSKTRSNGKDERITLQEWAEKNWGLEKGFLTNRPYRKNESLRAEDLTYFQKKVWKLNDGLTVLNLEKLDEWCFYQVCLESKYIANSEKEWKTHKWPKATHYIALENESEEIKYKKNNMKSLAFGYLHSEILTLPWKRKFTVLLGLTNARNELTEEVVHNLLFEMIMNSKSRPDGRTDIELFLEYYKNLNESEGRERLEAEFFLITLIDYNLVLEKFGTYKWLTKGMEIGNNKVEAIDFIVNPKKQTQVEDLEKELKLKKG